MRSDGRGLPRNGRSDAELLKLALPHFGGRQKALATFLGRQEAAISQWKRGARVMPEHTRRLLELALGLRAPIVPVQGMQKGVSILPVPEAMMADVTFQEAWRHLTAIWEARHHQPDLWKRITHLIALEAGFIQEDGQNINVRPQPRVTPKVG